MKQQQAQHTDILVSNAGVLADMRKRDSTEFRDFVELANKNDLAVLKYTGNK